MFSIRVETNLFNINIYFGYYALRRIAKYQLFEVYSVMLDFMKGGPTPSPRVKRIINAGKGKLQEI